MPGLSTIYKWIREDKNFANDITEARRTGAQTWLDTAIEILDREDIPPQQFQIIREKLHHIRFLASKLIALYGDKQVVETKGDSTLTIKWGDEVGKAEHERTPLVHANGVQKMEHNPDKKVLAINEA